MRTEAERGGEGDESGPTHSWRTSKPFGRRPGGRAKDQIPRRSRHDMTYLFWFHTLEGRIELSNTATAAACARACAVARRGGAPPPRPFSSPLTRTSSSSSCARPAQKCGISGWTIHSAREILFAARWRIGGIPR